MLYSVKNLPQLNNLISKLKSLNFSIETQYKFMKISSSVEKEMEILNQQISQIIDQYAERDTNGNPIINDQGYKINPSQIQECADKITELNTIQVQLPDLYFSLDELAPLNLTLEELTLLDSFIKV